MRFYWLYLIGFISFWTSIGLFKHFYVSDLLEDFSCDGSSNRSPHPFLCDKKISLHNATIADISRVDGISQKTAREIFSFLKDRKEASLNDLLVIKGVGERKLLRLRKWFY